MLPAMGDLLAYTIEKEMHSVIRESVNNIVRSVEDAAGRCYAASKVCFDLVRLCQIAAYPKPYSI